MRTKRIYKSVLMAAVGVVLGLSMGACVDNIDNSTTPSDNQQEQQAEQAQMTKAQKFWSVASQLVDVDDYTEDYEGKTFESTYGVEGSEAGTRYVYTNDAATAAERFADLVDCDDIDETTQSYTYDDPDVGKLVYTKGTGRILATVDVSIKQIPSLKKIVYVPGAYANKQFQGRAYYRFGDVISREVDGYDGNKVTEYWICVRPSFGPEGKGDSHWVCLNVLPKKNVWHYHSDTNGRDYYLPEGISTNKVQMQNLAEMLFAIYNPNKWEDDVRDVANTRLKMFNDFRKSNYNYHNAKFWKSVQNAWRKFNITALALNTDSTSARSLFTKDSPNKDMSLNLLYSGYSWWTKFSWNSTLYEAVYENGDAGKEKNMHKATYKEVTRDMRGFAMNCSQMGKTYYSNYNTFFTNKPAPQEQDDGDGTYRWTVRHATGKELSSDGLYSEKDSIHNAKNVYRYYRDVIENADLAKDPEVTKDVKTFDDPEEYVEEPDDPNEPEIIDRNHVKVGHIIGLSGTFYKNCEAAENHHDQAVAMVVYLGKNKRVEKNQEWNGLAIALEDVEPDEEGDNVDYCDFHSQAFFCTTAATSNEDLRGRCDGWAMTRKMRKQDCVASHLHPAAKTVFIAEKVTGCSEWFIPATGQWDMAMFGMGFGRYSKSDNGEWGYHGQGYWRFQKAGAVDAVLEEDGIYMTCTEYHNEIGRIFGFKYHASLDEVGFVETMKLPLGQNLIVRPFLAFAYGGGGSQNPEELWKE